MGYIMGFKVGMGDIMVSHLQFADDTMIIVLLRRHNWGISDVFLVVLRLYWD